MLFSRKQVIPVVHLDRHDKAIMIEAILAAHLGRNVENLRILDIGCGNGDISEYFAAHNSQFGVDVSDRRRPASTHFDFRQVTSEALPFDDGFFDIVLSHHVIEHVNDQDMHLAEIRRVVKDRGVVYLATPNRTSPIMKGHIGNNKVLRYRHMTALFSRHGFTVEEYAVKMLKHPDRYRLNVKYARHLPSWLIRVLRPWIPSHTFILTPATDRH